MTGPSRRRAPTIGDVARAAGVSVSTVSRVVRDHTDVQSATRIRVQEAIERLGFRPSPIARALVSGQTNLIALLISDIANPFYPQLAKSVEQEANRDDFAVVICNTADRPTDTHRYIERLLRQGLDGVIHASVGEDEDVLLSLIRDRRRMVFTNRRPTDDALSYVVSDNSEGARVLTEHLLQQGHRRIGFVNGPAYARNAIERLEGFRRAMARTADPQIFVVEGDFSLDSGRRAVAEWCQLPEPPSAVIAVNDTVALGVRESLAERGLRVPEDVALAGFDGVQLAASPILNLTTVDQHIDRLGQRAVQILLRQLADDGPLRPVQEVVPTQLLVRKSTQAPPRHERPARRRASPDDRRRLAVTDSTAKPRPW